MLARTVEIPCSKRCELVLALAYLQARQNMVAIAHCLSNDREKTAVAFAKKLLSLPESSATALAKQTLDNAGVRFNEH